MQKKFLSMVTALVMLISLLPQGIITVSAATITATQPSTDENGVYQIGTVAELYWFAGLVNGTLEGVAQNLSANAVLTENIVVNTGVLKADGTLADDTSGFTSWTPIGNSAYNYTGTFDGQGYTVSGLYCNDTNAYNVGLFGYVGSNETNKGSVSNVGVVDSYFNGYVRVGGVCGTAGDNSTITNCYSTAPASGTNQVGGVCGENYGAITDCYNTGTVSSSDNAGGVCGENCGTIANSYNTGIVSGNINVGGVCGAAGDGTIENCYNTGAVSGNENVGGVCGENYGTIAVCCNKGTVMGENYVGGMCGRNSTNTTITNCYNTGDVTVTGDSAYAGGLCGYTSVDSTITNCYNAGRITVAGDSVYAGGICGYNIIGNITNCYFDSEKYSGNAIAQNEDGTVTNVEGKTTEEFAIGEVAYLLQSGQEADENGNIPEVWGQEIGTDNYPVPGGAKVYQVVAYAGCEGNPGNESTVYSNTDAPVYGDHSFDSNGFCEYGDSGYQPAKWDETNNRYEISNAGQLYWFAGLVNGTLEGVTQNLSANAILTKNIVVNTGVLKSDGTLADDTSGFTSWTPIGNSDYNYTGTFDGQGYTVSGLYFNDTNAYYVGLFGYVGSGGRVSNVGVVDSYFCGHMKVGGVCGSAGDNSTITNCYNTGTVRGAIYVGGVCGSAGENSTISNCYNTRTVTGKSNVGGVCGTAGGNSTIKNCYNTGLVDGNDNGGGVCGENYGTIEVCYNTGPVIGIGKTGGVCGTAGDNSTIANCYNAGSIASSLYAGGVCGSAGDNSTITNCYNAGSVAASGNSASAGGVCGRNSNGNITNCYFDSEKYSGNAVAQNDNGTVTNVEGKTTDKFTSGEVAYLLQGKQSENVWGQEIGTDNYPVPGGAKVYQVVAYAGCEGNPGNESTAYSNTDAPVYGDHSFDSNGFCEYGDSGYQPAEWDETNNRYEISNAGQLYWFAGLVNGTLEGVTQNLSANAILTKNIVVNTGVLKADGTLLGDTSGFTSWTPIGSYDYNYTGTFDGRGYTVSGLYFNDEEAYNVGLFGYVASNETNKGSVSNVGVVDSYFNGYVRVGGVCGAAGENSTITNCYSTAAVSGINQVGGVCGENYGTIENCYNTGAVSGKNLVGGVCGANEGTIENCYNIGAVSGNENVGGVCGENYGTIENCYNTGAVSGKNLVGGVCGANSGTIAVCCNKGTVMGENRVGGVCGHNFANTTIANCYNAGGVTVTGDSAYAGGLCGFTTDQSTITNCYNAGSITVTGDSAYAGGICGYNIGGNIINCYFDSEKYSGNAVAQNDNGTVTNVEGKTTDKFTSGEVAYLLQGKQSENVWGQEIGTDNYPVLTSDIAKKVCKVEFKTLGADGEYTLYTERYGNYDKVLSDFPEEIRDTIWVDGVNQFTASSRVTDDKTVYPVGYSVKYDDDGKVVISTPKMGNYTIIIALYSGESLLRAKSADIQINNWYESYEITDLNGFDTTGADTVKVFFWDTEMRPQCDAAVKTLP